MARVPTLGQLHPPPGWVWVYCTRYVPLCQHSAPMALAPLIIRWGPEASSDMLRQCARYTACGHKGATLGHPGWVDGEVDGSRFQSRTKHVKLEPEVVPSELTRELSLACRCAR